MVYVSSGISPDLYLWTLKINGKFQHDIKRCTCMHACTLPIAKGLTSIIPLAVISVTQGADHK